MKDPSPSAQDTSLALLRQGLVNLKRELTDMDSAYGTGIDPTPYMFAAYGIGIFLLVGYTLTIFLARAKIRRLMAAMNADKHPNSKDNAYGTQR